MIRNAEITDVNSIAEIIVESLKTAYEGIVDSLYSHTLAADKFVSVFNENIASNNETIHVYEIGSKVVGFISGKIDSSNCKAEITGLYLNPEYKNRGIGSKLFDSIMDYFKKNNCPDVSLTTILGAKNNKFYSCKKAKVKKYIDLEFGNKKYNGVIYSFKI